MLAAMQTRRNLAVPFGTMSATTDGGRVVALRFGAAEETGPNCPTLDELRRQLGDYFAGTRTTFDMPLSLDGTPFQRKVWAELQKIGHGQTITYGTLARRVGDANAARAVGAANGKNPVALVVPCHRVVAADNKIGGYSGGGPDVKRWLLDHEAGATGSTSAA